MVADGGHYFRGGPEIQGLYLVRSAVSVTACYLAIQLLIAFAEVLLPFIFAVLCMIILEPFKRFISRILQRLTVIFLQRLNLEFMLESKLYTQMSGERASESPYDLRTPEAEAEDSAPEDAETSERPATIPARAVRQMILVVSIIVCLLTMARVLWITAKVFLRAGYAISADVEYYRAGAARVKHWIKHDIRNMHVQGLDWGKVLDELVAYVEEIGKVVTANVLNGALNLVVTLIFLLYMLWSPVKMESDTVIKEVFRSTGRYLLVKATISAITGLLVCLLLWACGLDLPAAFGVLAFLANFLPGIGSFVASALPCILAIIDVRKTPTQVLVAWVLQLAVHFLIDFFVEPVFFGISVEIHSVIVILGIWFFYQVWGVPGMLLSVPLLAVIRLLLKSMKHANQVDAIHGDDADAVVFWDSILQGRWMSTGGTGQLGDMGEMDHVGIELTDFPGKFPSSTGYMATPDPHAASAHLGGASVDDDEGMHWPATDSPLYSECISFYKEYGLAVDLAMLLSGFFILLLIPTLE